MERYLTLVEKILSDGKEKESRTGEKTIALSGLTFEHNMSEGFPLITTRKLKFENIASQLEFYIKGITDKKWLQDRGNPYWNYWANPKKVPYGTDEETREKMIAERDLGPVYGFPQRHWGAKYGKYSENIIIDFFTLASRGFKRDPAYAIDYTGRGIDQLKRLVDRLKENPSDRRAVVSSWNPNYENEMALPPCHFAYQAHIIGEEINLAWMQRSADFIIGVPSNIAEYALWLHLLSLEIGFMPGKLTGFFVDAHIYKNHIQGTLEQLKRQPRILPHVETKDFTNMFDWNYTQSSVKNYNPHPPIRFKIAV